MKIREMEAICIPLNISVERRSGKGFVVTARDEFVVKKLETSGFRVEVPDDGFDYMNGRVRVYVEPVIRQTPI